MKDQDFEKTMETWLDHEIKSATALRPKPALYRMVEARQKRPLLPFLSMRWGTAGAAIVGLLVTLVALLRFPTLLSIPTSPTEVAVALREGFPAEKMFAIEPTAPIRKGPEKGAEAFRQLRFEFQKPTIPFIKDIDLSAPSESVITITADDNYRLFLEPAEMHYIYVFQRTASDEFVQLFPNAAYTPLENPLEQGQAFYLPSPPNWLYLDDVEGTSRIYIIASTQPMADLDSYSTQYNQEQDKDRQQAIRSSLRDRLEALADTSSDQTFVRIFDFNHQK